jgi:hypothetical protein
MNLSGCSARAGALVGIPLLAAWLSGSPVEAQQAGTFSQPDLVPVVLWTFAAVCAAMLVLTLGYLYRRVRGAPDEVIPQNVDPYYAVEGQIEKHGTTELHPEMAHDDVGLDAAEREHAAPHDQILHGTAAGAAPLASVPGPVQGSAH